jgi:hypothetical protein
MTDASRSCTRVFVVFPITCACCRSSCVVPYSGRSGAWASAPQSGLAGRISVGRGDGASERAILRDDVDQAESLARKWKRLGRLSRGNEPICGLNGALLRPIRLCLFLQPREKISCTVRALICQGTESTLQLVHPVLKEFILHGVML